MKLIEIKNLNLYSPEKNYKMLNDITLTINSGDFILISGPSNSGKSTLLQTLYPKKNKNHQKYDGSLEFFINANEISFLPENPETQLLMSDVISELTFPLENLNYEKKEIHQRLAEVCNFFGINNLLDKETINLSGGQKQLISLCSAVITFPKLILLDNPISQLDPITADNFIRILKYINEELNIAIVITDNSCCNFFSYSQKLIFMNKDRRIIINDYVVPAMKEIYTDFREFRNFLPQVTHASLILKTSDIALTSKDLKFQLSNITNLDFSNKKNTFTEKTNELINLRNVSFKYGEQDKFIINSLNLQVLEKDIICLMGHNGSGKSTLLKIICGYLKPYMGTVKYYEKNIKYIPQNVLACFSKEIIDDKIFDFAHQKKSFSNLLKDFKLQDVIGKNIFDLNPSTQQKLANIIALSSDAKILLLDEPTKNLDAFDIGLLSQKIKEANKTKTIIISTHNLEFAASCSKKCALIFNGAISSLCSTYDFFSSNLYYTTQLNRAFKCLNKNIVTIEDLQNTN